MPVAWDAAQYIGAESTLSTNVTLSTPNKLPTTWQSVFVPVGMWAKSSEGTVLRGSVPSRGQLPGSVQQFGVSGVSFGSGETRIQGDAVAC